MATPARRGGWWRTCRRGSQRREREYLAAPSAPRKLSALFASPPSSNHHRLRHPFALGYAENVMTEDRSDSSDKFREFVKKVAGLRVPEDDLEEMRERRKQAAHETGCPVEEVTDEDVIVNADDEFLCSEALTLWSLIRETRELLRNLAA